MSSTQSEGSERRRAPRKRPEGHIAVRQLIRHTMGQERLLQAVVVNVSKSGILCRISPATEAYTRVSLELELSGGAEPRLMSCEGMVMRCQATTGGHETAIQITDFTGLDKQVYEGAVEALPPV